MMALNIAVPLTTVGDLMEGFGLLSPISPLSVDCRAVTTTGSHGKKQLVSPVGSESSGVSSLDSDEIKKPSSPPTTPTEEVERPSTSSPLPPSEATEPETTIVTDATEAKSSSCSSTRSSLSSTDSISSSDGSSSDEFAATLTQDDLSEPEPTIPKVVKVEIGGRNVLNLLDNLTSPDHFRLQFAQLPENDNIHFFLDNRSQYHRLGANGHIQEYTMVKCKCCDFRYPVNGTSPTNGGTTASMGQANLATIFQQQTQHQQPQQQQPFQWNSFNNYDSISNKNKVGVNVAVSAFNKTFGGSSNSSQYFRSHIAASLGRDSNRTNNSNNSGGNFLNSTSTYNNHKAYQQGFGSSNNNGSSKFNSQYGNYQFQQQQQQQSQHSQMFSKNQQMRYGSGNSNGSSAYNASPALAAAAAALANYNMPSANSYNGKFNNHHNMLTYYKAMMN